MLHNIELVNKVSRRKRKDKKLYSVCCKYCGSTYLGESPAEIRCDVCVKNKVNKRIKVSTNNTSLVVPASFYIYKRDNFKCIYCGKSSIEHGIELTIDHVYPLSKGGTNNLSNLVTCCFSCNTTKQATLLSPEMVELIWLRNMKANAVIGISKAILESAFNAIYKRRTIR